MAETRQILIRYLNVCENPETFLFVKTLHTDISGALASIAASLKNDVISLTSLTWDDRRGEFVVVIDSKREKWMGLIDPGC